MKYFEIGDKVRILSTTGLNKNIPDIAYIGGRFNIKNQYYVYKLKTSPNSLLGIGYFHENDLEPVVENEVKRVVKNSLNESNECEGLNIGKESNRLKERKAEKSTPLEPLTIYKLVAKADSYLPIEDIENFNYDMSMVGYKLYDTININDFFLEYISDKPDLTEWLEDHRYIEKNFTPFELKFEFESLKEFYIIDAIIGNITYDIVEALLKENVEDLNDYDEHDVNDILNRFYSVIWKKLIEIEGW